ncbi:MAG: hypothetical protein J3K34DRAFT_524796 [Monoraphidium minutum]|nr:MAG: hypothetical protein J3K34DRAFT_524796 [Monoraphidium minutum]
MMILGCPTRGCRAIIARAQRDDGPVEAPVSSKRRGLLTGTLGAGIAALPLQPPPGPADAAVQPPKPDPPAAPGAAAPPCAPRGAAAVRDPSINRGCATTAAARQKYGMQGLLPPREVPLSVEVARARAALAGCCSDFERHRLLLALKESNGAAFYALLQGPDLEALLRIACQRFGTLVPRPACLYVSAAMAGSVAEAVANWPSQGVRVAVVTDGERILGLGDLGCHGAGIPIGKCIVYAAAGLPPEWLLPVVVDVGTESAGLREGDPLYLGLPQRRLRGEAYYALMEELAFSMLQRLRGRGTPTFNDDIECTAAVTAAALLGALRLPGVAPLPQQRFLFFGAGQASLGTARLIVRLLQQRGVPESAARAAIWMVDRRGLDAKGRLPLELELGSGTPTTPRTGQSDAQAAAALLRAVIAAVRPTTLVGAATVGGAFDQGVVEAMVKSVATEGGAGARPVVFALSNPTEKAEVTYADAWRWSGGRVVYASGTAFPGLAVSEGGAAVPLRQAGLWEDAPGSSGGAGTGAAGAEGVGGAARLLRPAQCNNSAVFPGLALGCIATGAAAVNDDMLLAAAGAIAGMVTPEELSAECVLPGVARLRETAAAVAAAVAEMAYGDELGTVTVDSAKCLSALRSAEAVAQQQPAVDGVDAGIAAALKCVQRLQYSAAA